REAGRGLEGRPGAVQVPARRDEDARGGDARAGVPHRGRQGDRHHPLRDEGRDRGREQRAQGGEVEGGQAPRRFRTASDEPTLRATDGRRTPNPLYARQVELDKIQQNVAALGARRAEREAAVASAKTDDERTLAAERMTNFEWEERLERERLRAQEARIALQAK